MPVPLPKWCQEHCAVIRITSTSSLEVIQNTELYETSKECFPAQSFTARFSKHTLQHYFPLRGCSAAKLSSGLICPSWSILISVSRVSCSCKWKTVKRRVQHSCVHACACVFLHLRSNSVHNQERLSLILSESVCECARVHAHVKCPSPYRTERRKGKLP